MCLSQSSRSIWNEPNERLILITAYGEGKGRLDTNATSGLTDGTAYRLLAHAQQEPNMEAEVQSEPLALRQLVHE